MTVDDVFSELVWSEGCCCITIIAEVVPGVEDEADAGVLTIAIVTGAVRVLDGSLEALVAGGIKADATNEAASTLLIAGGDAVESSWVSCPENEAPLDICVETDIPE